MKKLVNIYYNPSHPASFSTALALWKAVKKSIPLHKVEEWLKKQPTYTLHKPVRKRFQRNSYLVFNIDDQWQADLNDLQSLQQYNKGNRYILSVIDLFSRFAWAVPVRSKTGEHIKEAFEKIFASTQRRPLRLQTDKGTEFLNKTFQNFLSKHNINFFTTNNPDIKASVIERFNRTLKQRMWKYFTAKKTYYYIDVLPKLVRAYNYRPHAAHKLAPALVNQKTFQQVWNRVMKVSHTSVKAKYKEGDTVRITKEKHHFAKGYKENWTLEIFKIKQIQHKEKKVVYVLEDLNGDVIDGTFYEEELQAVPLPQVYEIDEILETKGKRLLVRWKGYPASFNSWIPISYLKSVKKND